MYPNLPTSQASLDAFDASWLHEPVVYLILAALCLLVAARNLKRAIAPVAVLVRAVAAAAVVAFAIGLALILVAAAALGVG